MNKFIINIVLVLLLVSCSNLNGQSNKDANVKTTKIEKIKISEVLNIANALYDIQFRIETTENNTHNLIVAIKLVDDSHYLSPHARADKKVKFYMDLGSYKDLTFDGDQIETPASVADFGPQSNDDGLEDWVRASLSFKQALHIESKDDFEVFGRVLFTIDPLRATEVVPFTISSQNGVIKITNAKC